MDKRKVRPSPLRLSDINVPCTSRNMRGMPAVDCAKFDFAAPISQDWSER